ncbi:MAG: DUF72 domain-containing protein [candidate division Zixibacteria bacterium]|nr:DUF72 domain-containing protein [candidate division Zixibacteria bacterium]
MSKGSLYIGTSGWNYDHWVGAFYPENLKPHEWLQYYFQRFDTVEINNSFYNLPKKEQFETWRKASPDNFLYSVKASRYITHMKKLKDPDEPVNNFISRAKILKPKLGPVLFQLPPKWRCNIERIEAFVGLLPDKHRFTFEFRDKSWWNDDVYNILKQHNIAFCIFDLEGEMSPKEKTADFIYIRLHGPNGAYKGKYGKRKLASWAGAINSWLDNGLDVYCYFDNDEKGYAPQDALALKEMLE